MRSEIEQLLFSLPEIIDVRYLTENARQALTVLEKRYEQSSLLPLRNMGMEAVLAKKECYVLLKTGSFRPPSAPLVLIAEKVNREQASSVWVGTKS